MRKTVFIFVPAIFFFLGFQSNLAAGRLDIVDTSQRIVSSLQDGTSRADFKDHLDQFYRQIDDYYRSSAGNTLFLDYALDFYRTSRSILDQFEARDQSDIFIREDDKNIRMGLEKREANSDDKGQGIRFSESKDSLSMQLNSRSSEDFASTRELYRQACHLLTNMHLFIDIGPDLNRRK